VTRRILPFLLLASGAAALVLEVAWFRRTAQLAGGTSVAMGAVLAAVIGGMALGSFWLGRIADRVARPVRLYGVLELGIALCAVLSPMLLDASAGGFVWLSRALDGSPLLGSVARFAFAVVLLALPAVLMGGSLPAAAAAFPSTPETRGRAIGLLYGLNTLGAVAGTLLAGFVLLPRLGLANTMRAAAVLSGLAGIVAFLLPASRGAEPAPVEGGVDARRAILLYSVSGFLGLFAEVAFTRSLVLVFGSTTYAFSVMLAVFLLGIGAGSLFGMRLARTPGRHRARLETTLAVTAALFSLSGLLVYALPRLYLEGYVTFGSEFGVGMMLRFLLALLVLLPGALGLGVAFPLAVHLAGAGRAGAGTGRLYAANTVASIAGSTFAVFLFVPLLGPQYALVLVALAACLAAAISARRVGVWVLLGVTALGLIPPAQTAEERLLSGVYFAPGGWLDEDGIDEVSWAEGVDIPFVAYGHEATVSIWRWYGKSSVLVDGKAVATNQVLADEHHLSLLGHLPMRMHPDPQRVLVIGLGMGTTYRAVALHEPEVLRVIEIEEEVVEAAARLGIAPKDVVVDDARIYLRAIDETFDVITSDPIHPWVRGGGDLYSREYFEWCRARLADGGVVCQWLPVYQMGLENVKNVARTFCSVFRTSAYFGGGDLVLVGTAESIVPEPADLNLPEAAFGLENRLSSLLVAEHNTLVRAAGPGPLLTDDALRLEFSAPRHVDDRELGECFAWIRGLWMRMPPPYFPVLTSMEAWARGDWDLHLRLVRKGLEEFPEHPFVRRYAGEVYLGLAGVFVRRGRLEDAAQYLESSAGRLEGDPRLIGVEAELRAAEGKKAEARELYEELLKSMPDSRYLSRKIDALR
jgi:spermidine synthase